MISASDPGLLPKLRENLPPKFVLVGLLVGLFFGSYYARVKQTHQWDLTLHSKYIVRALLERFK